jgi:hypothetical protein
MIGGLKMVEPRKGIKAELPPEEWKKLKQLDKIIGKAIEAAFAKPENPRLPLGVYIVGTLFIAVIIGVIFLVVIGLVVL